MNNGKPPTLFTIPKKKRKPAAETLVAPVKSLQRKSVPKGSDEYRQIYSVIETNLNDKEFIKFVDIIDVVKFGNDYLQWKFNKFEQVVKKNGHKATSSWGFREILNGDEELFYATHGLPTNSTHIGDIGDPAQGVYVYQYADLTSSSFYYRLLPISVMIFKTIRGKPYKVGIGSPSISPCSGHFCHAATSTEDLPKDAKLGQRLSHRLAAFYHYEHDANGDALQFPSGVLPYAMVRLEVIDWRSKKMGKIPRQLNCYFYEYSLHTISSFDCTFPGFDAMTVQLLTPFVPGEVTPGIGSGRINFIGDGFWPVCLLEDLAGIKQLSSDKLFGSLLVKREVEFIAEDEKKMYATYCVMSSPEQKFKTMAVDMYANGVFWCVVDLTRSVSVFLPSGEMSALFGFPSLPESLHVISISTQSHFSEEQEDERKIAICARSDYEHKQLLEISKKDALETVRQTAEFIENHDILFQEYQSCFKNLENVNTVSSPPPLMAPLISPVVPSNQLDDNIDESESTPEVSILLDVGSPYTGKGILREEVPENSEASRRKLRVIWHQDVTDIKCDKNAYGKRSVVDERMNADRNRLQKAPRTSAYLQPTPQPPPLPLRVPPSGISEPPILPVPPPADTMRSNALFMAGMSGAHTEFDKGISNHDNRSLPLFKAYSEPFEKVPPIDERKRPDANEKNRLSSFPKPPTNVSNPDFNNEFAESQPNSSSTLNGRSNVKFSSIASLPLPNKAKLDAKNSANEYSDEIFDNDSMDIETEEDEVEDSNDAEKSKTNEEIEEIVLSSSEEILPSVSSNVNDLFDEPSEDDNSNDKKDVDEFDEDDEPADGADLLNFVLNSSRQKDLPPAPKDFSTISTVLQQRPEIQETVSSLRGSSIFLNLIGAKRNSRTSSTEMQNDHEKEPSPDKTSAKDIDERKDTNATSIPIHFSLSKPVQTQKVEPTKIQIFNVDEDEEDSNDELDKNKKKDVDSRDRNKEREQSREKDHDYRRENDKDRDKRDKDYRTNRRNSRDHQKSSNNFSSRKENKLDPPSATVLAPNLTEIPMPPSAEAQKKQQWMNMMRSNAKKKAEEQQKYKNTPESNILLGLGISQATRDLFMQNASQNVMHADFGSYQPFPQPKPMPPLIVQPEVLVSDSPASPTFSDQPGSPCHPIIIIDDTPPITLDIDEDNEIEGPASPPHEDICASNMFPIPVPTEGIEDGWETITVTQEANINLPTKRTSKEWKKPIDHDKLEINKIQPTTSNDCAIEGWTNAIYGKETGARKVSKNSTEENREDGEVVSDEEDDVRPTTEKTNHKKISGEKPREDISPSKIESRNDVAGPKDNLQMPPAPIPQSPLRFPNPRPIEAAGQAPQPNTSLFIPGQRRPLLSSAPVYSAPRYPNMAPFSAFSSNTSGLAETFPRQPFNGPVGPPFGSPVADPSRHGVLPIPYGQTPHNSLSRFSSLHPANQQAQIQRQNDTESRVRANIAPYQGLLVVPDRTLFNRVVTNPQVLESICERLQTLTSMENTTAVLQMHYSVMNALTEKAEEKNNAQTTQGIYKSILKRYHERGIVRILTEHSCDKSGTIRSGDLIECFKKIGQHAYSVNLKTIYLSKLGHDSVQGKEITQLGIEICTPDQFLEKYGASR